MRFVLLSGVHTTAYVYLSIFWCLAKLKLAVKIEKPFNSAFLEIMNFVTAYLDGGNKFKHYALYIVKFMALKINTTVGYQNEK